jgi:hypothetical protein
MSAVSQIRAVIADDGGSIVLVIGSAAEVSTVDLDPLQALGLGSQLIEAGRQRLLRQQAAPARRNRGGDPKAAHRRERDAAVCALARLWAPGRPIEEQARIVIDRVRRYQPAAGEIGVDRQFMSQIRAAGLPLPTVDRVARIIRSATQSGEQKVDWIPDEHP